MDGCRIPSMRSLRMRCDRCRNPVQPFRTGQAPRRRTQCGAFIGKRLQHLFARGSAPRLNEPQPFRLSDTRTIGGIEGVSPMGMGTWAWGNKFLWGYDPSMDAELQEIFDYVVEQGVTLFDTADSYGTGALNGRSEQLLGRFIRENPRAAAGREIHVATKLAGYPWRVTPWNMTAACRGSLRRLQTEQVAIGQLHWSAAKYAPLQEWSMVNGIADCYLEGLVRAVGVSNYGPKQLRKVHAELESRGVKLASAQVQFSLLSWGAAQQEIVDVARELDVALIAYSPLALGLLSGKYAAGDVPEGPRGQLFNQLLPDVEPVTATLRDVAQQCGRSESQVALNWCMCKGTIPIPGVKTLAMAQDNLGAFGWRLSRDEELALDTAALSLKKGMVQNIFQTS